MNKMIIPKEVKKMMKHLEQAGYESYVVGGCVRDVLMQKSPSDWDICTSATPEQMKGALASYETVDVGIRHGTIGILTGGKAYEMTTYRIDGQYLDSRHPESITFTPNIQEDLGRRDFTINAMAYNELHGLVDIFDGQLDLAQKQIRCVGKPEKRFEEDALRILRGLRFAAVLGFSVEEKTGMAMHTGKEAIRNISVERVKREFEKLIKGKKAAEILGEYMEVIHVFAPNMCRDNIELLESVPDDVPVRLALLFPKDTEKSLKALMFSKWIVAATAQLVELKDYKVEPDKIVMKKMMNKIGLAQSRYLLELKAAYGEDTSTCRKLVEDIVCKEDCYRLEQMLIDGNDLMEEGFLPGPEIGYVLERLLMAIIEEKAVNCKEGLMEMAKKMRN